MAYDGLTGDLLKAELRLGSVYTSKNAKDFVYSLLLEFQEDYPTINVYLRGDSAIADVMLYESLEYNSITYAIRLKDSGPLRNAAVDHVTELCKLTKENNINYAVIYGEFFYKAGSWLYPRRVAVKVEKPYGKLNHLYTFIVTNWKEILRMSFTSTAIAEPWRTLLRNQNPGFIWMP